MSSSEERSLSQCWSVMGALEKTHVEEFVHSVTSSGGPGQRINLHIHVVSFLGFFLFSLVVTLIILNEVASCSSLAAFNLHHSSVLVVLTGKKKCQRNLFYSSLCDLP